MTAFTTGPLPQRLKIVHGFGAVAFGVKDSGFSFFLLIFYNQVLGMNAALVNGASWTPDRLRSKLGEALVDGWASLRLARSHAIVVASVR